MIYRHIDLFSGIGGWGYAANIVFGEDYHNLAFVEIDPFGQHIIRKNFGENTNIQGDVHQFDATIFEGEVDILTASWPCQSFSVAGNRRGTDDDRYLWPQALRVLRECKPRWFIGENVGGFISLGLDQTLSDLEKEGYSTEAFVLPAVGVNSPHQRNRVWIVAHSNSNQYRQAKSRGLGEENELSSFNREEYSTTRESSGTGGQSGNVANSNNARVCTQRQDSDKIRKKSNKGRKGFSQSESSGYSDDVSNSNGSTNETKRRECEIISKDGISRENDRRGSENSIKRKISVRSAGSSEDVSNSNSKRLEGSVYDREGSTEEERAITRRIEEGTNTEFSINKFREWRNRWWSDECGLGIHPDGVSDRLDCSGWECGVSRITQGEKEAYYEERLKALGNSIVPQIPMTLFWFIKRIDQELGLK